MRTILLTFIFVPALLPRPALADPFSPPPPPVFAAASAVTMTAFLDKSMYQIGQPIVLEVDLHNTGAREAWVGNSAFEKSAFQFTMTEASGRIVPRTALGDLVFTPPWAVAANAGITLAPGATRRCRFNLTVLYGLLRSGHYTVIVRHTLGHFLLHGPAPALTAGPLRFQITKATASQNAPVFVHDPAADLNVP